MSHPATKQDIWVLEHFPGLKGTFCEVGAYDGVTHSNTLLLDQSGWTGTLIEACRAHYLKCLNARPECDVYHNAIGRRGGEERFVMGGQYSGIIRTMPKEFLDEHSRRGNKTTWMYTEPLYDFVIDCDYLSISTEGNEYEILEDWIRDGGRAQAITVKFLYDREKLRLFEWLLGDHGYDLDEIRGFDLCFLRRD